VQRQLTALANGYVSLPSEVVQGFRLKTTVQGGTQASACLLGKAIDVVFEVPST
jgi:hypothetical protein